jgi:hypothetical protein
MSAVHDVLVNLEDQVRLYRHLLELSSAQLAALRKQDVHSVHAILQEIEIAMLDRGKLEMQRSVVLSLAAAELGIGVEEITAARLEEAAGAPLGGEIARCADELRQIVTQLDEVVARNRAMLEHELGVIDQVVQGMTVDREATPVYGKSGAQREVPRLRLLDAQV